MNNNIEVAGNMVLFTQNSVEEALDLSFKGYQDTVDNPEKDVAKEANIPGELHATTDDKTEGSDGMPHEEAGNTSQDEAGEFQTDVDKAKDKDDDNQARPGVSFSVLIMMAINESPHQRITLSGIYEFIMKRYPFFNESNKKSWQNSVRHNLSVNKCFARLAKGRSESGKGCYWVLTSCGYEASVKQGKLHTGISEGPGTSKNSPPPQEPTLNPQFQNFPTMVGTPSFRQQGSQRFLPYQVQRKPVRAGYFSQRQPFTSSLIAPVSPCYLPCCYQPYLYPMPSANALQSQQCGPARCCTLSVTEYAVSLRTAPLQSCPVSPALDLSKKY